MRTERDIPVHVGAFIRQEDRFLAVLREGDDFNGMLGLPGGHVKERESYEDALIREVLEETGHTVEITGNTPKIVGEVLINDESVRVLIYKATISGEHIESKDDEVQKVLWVKAHRFIESLRQHSYPQEEIKKLARFLESEGLL